VLEDLLGSRTRASLIRLLLDDPARAFHLRELVRAVGGGVSSVQAEVARLERLGIVTSTRDERGWRIIRLVAGHPVASAFAGLIAAEAVAAYGSAATAEPSTPGVAALNPRVSPLVPAIAAACRRFGCTSAALFGSATQPDVTVVPRDLDVLVTFDPSDERPRADRYFGLKQELARATGLPVDLVEADSVRNPFLRAAIDDGKVDLYASA
jgi:predicted nucleotidyltransferase/DNA-binding transcriptional ArsR family regulator